LSGGILPGRVLARWILTRRVLPLRILAEQQSRGQKGCGREFDSVLEVEPHQGHRSLVIIRV